MTNKTRAKRPTYAQLQRKVDEMTAMLAVVHESALLNLKKASTDRLLGSGVYVQLTEIGGKEIINPVLIRDGLSPDTLDALKNDIIRSRDLVKSGL